MLRLLVEYFVITEILLLSLTRTRPDTQCLQSLLLFFFVNVFVSVSVTTLPRFTYLTHSLTHSLIPPVARLRTHLFTYLRICSRIASCLLISFTKYLSQKLFQIANMKLKSINVIKNYFLFCADLNYDFHNFGHFFARHFGSVCEILALVDELGAT